MQFFEGVPLLLLLLCSSARCVSGEPLVQTNLGILRGRHNGLVQEFLGVRYAQQPKRFGQAIPDTEAWIGIRNASSRAPRCWEPSAFPCIPQPGVPAAVGCKSANSHSMSEDCLFLDIYRPTLEGRQIAPKAVMVWIHGGGMTMGDSGSAPIFGSGNGTVLAYEQDVIVVSINYRLGPLGFLPLWPFGDSGRGNGGMNGLNDQIVALRWINSHVGSFGGDASRITVFGCSAGSLSICTLSTSPRATGLFRHAILESGPCLGPWGPGSDAEGKAVAARFYANLNISHIDDLLALPPWAFMWGQGQDQYDIEFPGYWVDGWVAPEHPAVQLRRGVWHPEAIILGGNSRDGVVSTSYVPAALMPTGTNSTIYKQALLEHWRPHNRSGGVYGASRLLSRAVADEVAAAYPLERFTHGGGSAGAFKAADGDYHVVCPAREIARIVENNGQRAYLYYFTHGPLLELGCGGRPDIGHLTPLSDGWANHGDEQLFVFGVSNQSSTCRFKPTELHLSQTIQKLWASFAKNGKPAVSANVTWRRFGTMGEALRLALGNKLELIPRFGSQPESASVDCDMWLNVTGEYGSQSRGNDETSYWTRGDARWILPHELSYTARDLMTDSSKVIFY